jgi:hypothetical protein
VCGLLLPLNYIYGEQLGLPFGGNLINFTLAVYGDIGGNIVDIVLTMSGYVCVCVCVCVWLSFV